MLQMAQKLADDENIAERWGFFLSFVFFTPNFFFCSDSLQVILNQFWNETKFGVPKWLPLMWLHHLISYHSVWWYVID